MEEINIQEWDNLQPDPISDKIKVELALIDLYNRLAIQIPTNHQAILDELAEKLLSPEASLTVKQVDSSLDASISETKLTVDRAYNFLREMKLNEVAEKRDQDYMYNWIREKSGKK
jgi:type VI protein secretion system component VasK